MPLAIARCRRNQPLHVPLPEGTTSGPLPAFPHSQLCCSPCARDRQAGLPRSAIAHLFDV
eukprot:scaffold2908_cov105-Isochrysis_galbana.AAC.1